MSVMNNLGHLFTLFLFTAFVVCQENSTTTVEPPSNVTDIDTTPVEETNVTGAENVTTSATTVPTPASTTVSPIGNWTVEYNDTICIMVVMNAEFHITYDTENGTNTTKLPLDPGALVNETASNCTDGRMVISLGTRSSLTLDFAKDGNTVFLANIILDMFVDKKRFPDVVKEKVYEYSSFNNTLFDTSAGKSYLCKANTVVSLSNGTIEVKDLQLEAFRTKQESGFSEAEECSADDGDVSDIVPIAVGCALAGLVVIVLIAYLVGRRHKRQKGYESV